MKISELHINQLTEHAMQAFMMEGSSQTTARLLYRALSIELTHARALTLTIQWIMDTRKPMDLRAMLAAPVVAYLSQPEVQVNTKDKEYFVMVRTMCLHQWGFARHKSTGPSARMGEFSNPALFDFDVDRFTQFVLQAIELAGSIEKALVVVRTVVGVSGKLLVHKELSDTFPIQDLFQPDSFLPSPDYPVWLETSADALPEHRPVDNRSDEK